MEYYCTVIYKDRAGVIKVTTVRSDNPITLDTRESMWHKIGIDRNTTENVKMSYDVSIGEFSRNYTSNVSSLWYDHIPKQDSCGGLHELHGKNGFEAAIILGAAFDSMNKLRLEQNSTGDTKMLAKYDCESGWGSLVGALIFTAEILAACAEHPFSKVDVCV